MDETSGVLAVAAKHGTQALIIALGGPQELGTLGGEIASTLLTRESRMNERFDALDRQLEEVLDQRFATDMLAGSRLFLDALGSSGHHREADLERARGHLVQAAAAARSNLQQARAERQLMLTYLMQERNNLAVRALSEMEAAALLALIEATPSKYPSLAAAAVATQTAVTIVREGAALAPALGLPRRTLDRLAWVGINEADVRPPRWIAISAGNTHLRIGGMEAWFSWSPGTSPLPPDFNLYPSPARGVLAKKYLLQASLHRPTALHFRFDAPLSIDVAVRLSSRAESATISTGTTSIDIPVGAKLKCFGVGFVGSPYEPISIGLRLASLSADRKRQPEYVWGLELLPGPSAA